MNTQATNTNTSPGLQQEIPTAQYLAHSPMLIPMMKYTSSGAQTPELLTGTMIPMTNQNSLSMTTQASAGSMVSISPAPMFVPNMSGQDSLQQLANGLPIAQLTGNTSPLQFPPAFSPQGSAYPGGIIYTTPSPLPYITPSPVNATYTPQLTTASPHLLPMATVHTSYPLLQPPSPVNGYQPQQPVSHFQFHPEPQQPNANARTTRKRSPENGAETFGMATAAAPMKSNLFQEPRRGPGPQPQKGQRQKKYAYRSKQKKIDRVYNHIKDMYEQQGKFAAEKELVRGDDTLRIHVKTFDGLSDIVTALNEVEQHQEVETTRLAAVFSKKNKFQKKGFIVYLKLGDERQKELAETIFQRYAQSLKNVATAKARDDVAAASAEATTEKATSTTSADCFDAAPPLRKLNSAGYAA